LLIKDIGPSLILRKQIHHPKKQQSKADAAFKAEQEKRRRAETGGPRIQGVRRPRDVRSVLEYDRFFSTINSGIDA
jgi:hypothetical protein